MLSNQTSIIFISIILMLSNQTLIQCIAIINSDYPKLLDTQKDAIIHSYIKQNGLTIPECMIIESDNLDQLNCKQCRL